MQLMSLILRCKNAWLTIFKCKQWCLISVVLNCDEKIIEGTKVTKILLSCRTVYALSLVLVQWDHILSKGSDLHTSDKRPQQTKKTNFGKMKTNIGKTKQAGREHIKMQSILSHFNNRKTGHNERGEKCYLEIRKLQQTRKLQNMCLRPSTNQSMHVTHVFDGNE